MVASRRCVSSRASIDARHRHEEVLECSGVPRDAHRMIGATSYNMSCLDVIASMRCDVLCEASPSEETLRHAHDHHVERDFGVADEIGVHLKAEISVRPESLAQIAVIASSPEWDVPAASVPIFILGRIATAALLDGLPRRSTFMLDCGEHVGHDARIRHARSANAMAEIEKTRVAR